MADVRFYVQQEGLSLYSDSTWQYGRADRTGALATYNWKENLLLEGRCWTAAFGAMGATDPVTLTAGNDLDQPDFCVSVPSGTSLIPLYINIAAMTPLDAAEADAHFTVCADTTAAYAGDGTVTAVTPVNMISGKTTVSTVATVFEDASADITDPTVTDIIVARRMQTDIATEMSAVDLNIVYDPSLPRILTGPCAIYGYGGSVSNDVVLWAGVVHWAEVPSTRYS